jgi:hypothetical protein
VSLILHLPLSTGEGKPACPVPARFRAYRSVGEGRDRVTGEYPAIPALQGGVMGYNIKETPCRKAPPFRAESFNSGGMLKEKYNET